MPLEEAILDIPLGGEDRRSEPRLVNVGGALRSENASRTRTGAIKKSQGLTELDPAVKVTTWAGVTHTLNPVQAFDADGVLGVVNGDSNNHMNVTLSPGLDGSKRWVNQILPGCAKEFDFPNAKVVEDDCDAAFLLGHGILAGAVAGISKYDISGNTEDIVSPAGTIRTSTRSCAAGSYLYAVSRSGTDLRLYYWTAGSVVNSYVTIAANAGSDYLAISPSTGNKVLIVYGTNVPDTRVIECDTTGVTAGPYTIAATLGASPAVIRATSYINVAYKDAATNNLRLVGLTTGLAASWGPTTIATSASIGYVEGCVSKDQSGNEAGYWFWNDQVTTAPFTAHQVMRFANILSAATATTDANAVQVHCVGPTLASRPFVNPFNATHPLVWLHYEAGTTTAPTAPPPQACYLLTSAARWSLATHNFGCAVHARALYGRAAMGASSIPSFVSQLETGAYAIHAKENLATRQVLGAYYQDIAHRVLVWDSNHKLQTIKVGGHTYINGARLYDAAGGEVGFPMHPEILGCTYTAGANAAATYKMSAVISAKTQSGDIILSEPSPAFTYNPGAAWVQIAAMVYVPPLADVYANAYKDVTLHLSVSDPGGTVLYKSGSTILATPRTGAVYESVSFNSSSGSSTLNEGEVLYTESSLAYQMPPSFAGIAARDGRIYGIRANGEIWYSLPRVEGEALGFNESLALPINDGDGWDAQIHEIDGNLIAMTSSGVRVVGGEGYDLNGLGQNINQGPIVSMSGLTRYAPSVRGSLGAYYKSKRGIYRISRGAQLDQVGAPVDDLQTQTLVAACYLPVDEEVIFFNASGPHAVLHEPSGQWSRMTPSSAAHAAVVADKLFLVESGIIGVRATSYDPFVAGDMDAESFLLHETPWLKPRGLSGKMRIIEVDILGEWLSANTVSVTLFTDYGKSAVNTQSFVLGTSGRVSGDPVQLNIDLGYECESFKLKLEVVPSGTDNGGLIISGISARVGFKSGNRSPDSASYAG